MIYPQTLEVLDTAIPDMLLEKIFILEEDEIAQITFIWEGPFISGELDFLYSLN